MAFDLSRNHFELFGLPVRFNVPLDQVDASYRDIQSQVHPDRFASASDAERRVSMQWATRVNEAYQTLKSPLKRATYLLEQRGMDVGAESNTAMPADFLMAQMEWREAVEEAANDGNVAALDELLRKLRGEMNAYYGELGHLIDEANDDDSAVKMVRKLMFLERLQSEIGDAIADMEG
jgi:molecular chaperone HscB